MVIIALLQVVSVINGPCGSVSIAYGFCWFWHMLLCLTCLMCLCTFWTFYLKWLFCKLIWDLGSSREDPPFLLLVPEGTQSGNRAWEHSRWPQSQPPPVIILWRTVNINTVSPAPCSKFRGLADSTRVKNVNEVRYQVTPVCLQDPMECNITPPTRLRSLAC